MFVLIAYFLLCALISTAVWLYVAFVARGRDLPARLTEAKPRMDHALRQGREALETRRAARARGVRGDQAPQRG